MFTFLLAWACSCIQVTGDLEWHDGHEIALTYYDCNDYTKLLAIIKSEIKSSSNELDGISYIDVNSDLVISWPVSKAWWILQDEFWFSPYGRTQFNAQFNVPWKMFCKSCQFLSHKSFQTQYLFENITPLFAGENDLQVGVGIYRIR